MPDTQTRGSLYDQATAFMAALEAEEDAAVQRLLVAWSDAYWAVRQELDTLQAKVAAARAQGVPVNRSWLNQQQRLQNVVGTVRDQMTRYATLAGAQTAQQQRRALLAALSDADALMAETVAQGLPGATVALSSTNPDLLPRMVGLLGDGSPVTRMAASLGADAADRLRDVLLRGLTQGWSQPRMVRAFTEGLAVTHSRAVTILRTESLRVYRETSRQTYLANRTVIGTWVWTCALDRRSCMSCVAMHGTEHDLEETLDDHPRGRCAMVPRTRSWEDLGIQGLEDTRPTVQPGTEWFAGLGSRTQRAMMGPRKYDAWRAGEFDLPDLVSRRWSDDWGSMRSERSLVAIREGRNGNWSGTRPDAPPPSRYDAAARAQGERIYRASTPEMRAKYLAQFAPGGDLADPGMYAFLRAIQDDLDAQPTWAAPWVRMDPEDAEAACRAVNPDWVGANRIGNCTNVTTAWELRRRGLDVIARKNVDGRPLTDFNAAWGVTSRRMTWLQADKAIAQLPDGARGSLTCQWKGGGAHIFNWEVRDGQVYWWEGQDGSGAKSLERLRARARNHVWWSRLDNATITESLEGYVEGR